MNEPINGKDRYKTCSYFSDCRKQILHEPEPELNFLGQRFWSWILLEEQETLAKLILVALFVTLAWGLSVFAGYKLELYSLMPLFFSVIVAALLVGPWLAVILSITLPLLADYYFMPPVGEVMKSWGDVGRFVLFAFFSGGAIFIVYSLIEGFRGVFLAHKVAKAARLEAELAREEAERAKAAKSDFLANMSHEIRTPLNGISGLIQLFASEPLSAKQKGYVKSLESVSEQLHTTINNILDFSKLDAGSLAAEDAVFDLRKVIADTVGIFKPLSRSKGLGFFVNTKANGVYLFRGDSLRVRQILNNLLSNAIKFTSKGKIVLEVDVKVLRPGTLAQLVFHVSDTGIGISSDAKKHLFSHFFQAEASTARRFGGSGLGLAISKQLADLMGGRIEVMSKVGEGSTFRFELPLPIASQNHHVRAEKELIPEGIKDDLEFSRTRHLHTVLIAEDNELNLQIAISMLTNAGYKVVAARNGHEVLSRISDHKCSVILMDLQMPELDGYETTKELRARSVHVPIIAVTAHAAPADRVRCLQAGMCDYLSKPFKQEQLVHMIDNWVLRSFPTRCEYVDCGRIKQLQSVAIGEQKDLIPRLLVLFENDSQSFRKEFSALVKADNRAALQSRVHSFKSASANLGLKKVVSILEKIESGNLSSQALKDLGIELDVELGRGLRELKSMQEICA